MNWCVQPTETCQPQ